MTAVMRAVQPTNLPKVLRVGVFEGGRIVEERVIKHGAGVTVGPNEKATFVVQAKLPAELKLFERVGRDYCLNFLDGMSGRVALATGVADLATLKGVARRAGAAYQVRLTEEARGKIVIGDTTFLFQFVVPPPAQVRPQLPLSVKGGLASHVDWTLTVIAAFSFLGHFAFVGGMYSDWMDPVVDQDVSVGMLHIVPETPRQPAVSTPVEVAGKPVVADPDHLSPPTPDVVHKPHPAPEVDPVAVAGLAVQDLMKGITTLHVKELAAFGSDHPAIASVMNGPNAPVDVNTIGDKRVVIAGGQLDLPTDSGLPIAIHPGALPVTVTHTAPDVDTAGKARRIEIAVTHEPPTTTLPPKMTIDIEAVIRTQIFPRARRCYQHGLDHDPNQQGKVVLSIRVDPSGEVGGASIAANTGLTAEVTGCISEAAKAAQFGKNPGGVVQVPFNFVRQ
jgi:hypothetical protein